MKTTDSLLFVFAGGGSGGHLQPGLAIVAELQQRLPGSQFLFLCSGRPIDQQILSAAAAADPRIRWNVVAGSRSSSGLYRFMEPLRLSIECFRAVRLLRQQRPTVVIGLGARASLAGCLAARILAVPVLLLELNCIPGTATRLLSRFAKLCLTGLPLAEEAVVAMHCAVEQAGVPVRPGIAELHGELYVAEPAQPRLLVLGGSQGAQTLNAAVLQSLETGTTLPGDWQIVHQAGDHEAAELRQRYQQLGLQARVEPYLREMAEELRSATLVVSRAGAGILAELACARRPAVLLPLPSSAGDHQRRNAGLFEFHKAAEVVETAAAAATVAAELRTKLARLSRDAEERQRMSVAAARMAVPQAVQHVVQRVLETIAAAD